LKTFKAHELYALAVQVEGFPTLILKIGDTPIKSDAVKNEMDKIMGLALDAAEKEKTYIEIEGKILPENSLELMDLGFSVLKKHRIGFHRNDYTIIDFDVKSKLKKLKELEED
jgi:hypothetical protein